MEKSTKVKARPRTPIELRKLAQSLIMLAELEQQKRPPKDSKRKAS